MKVHELAKELNTSTKELIEIAKGIGIEVTNHLNVLEENQVEEIKSKFDSVKVTLLTEPTNQESIAQKENQELKCRLEEMEKMMKQLMDQSNQVNQTIKEEEPTLPKPEKTDYQIDYSFDDDEIPEIPMNKAIKVMSLFSGGLNLKTSETGDAQVIRFEYIGQVMPILYQDLVKIVANQRSFFEQGYCMILDRNVVKTHYLEEHYKKFVDGRVINNILEYEVEKIKEIVSNATPVIQQSIVDVLIKKINDNEFVDKNKVTAIGEIYKHDVFELASKLK